MYLWIVTSFIVERERNGLRFNHTVMEENITICYLSAVDVTMHDNNVKSIVIFSTIWDVLKTVRLSFSLSAFIPSTIDRVCGGVVR